MSQVPNAGDAIGPKPDASQEVTETTNADFLAHLEIPDKPKTEEVE